ncbi:MAG: S8 family serine peptidase [Chthonomonas sp.]|nr:S8 family serine peptidase [Chthonomonas sp.]
MKRAIFVCALAFGTGRGAFGQLKGDQYIACPLPVTNSRSLSQLALTIDLVDQLPLSKTWIVRAKRGETGEAMARRLRRSGQFSFVTKDRVLAPAVSPNDPLFNQQWHLAQISAPRAWDFVIGAQAPIVAFVDTGVDVNHPDLIPNLIPGYNSVLDQYQSNGATVSDNTASFAHGTFVAGVISAKGNNGIGVSGVGWNIRLLPVKASHDPSGDAFESDLLQGAEVAATMGAKVVNVSYSGVEEPAVQVTGAALRANGVNLVWAAGNDGVNLSGFDWPDVTVVGATQSNDVKSGFSNFGLAVDCFAPGSAIRSTYRNGLYTVGDGTSFAAPAVSAALALMAERQPALTPAQRENQILRRCRDLGATGNDVYWGWGRVNLASAIESPIRKYHLSIVATPFPDSNTWGTWMDDQGNLLMELATPLEGSHHYRALNGMLTGPVPPPYPIPSPVSAPITDVSNNGLAVGFAYDQSTSNGFWGSLGGSQGFTNYPIVNGYSWVQPLGVNDLGDSVGRYAHVGDFSAEVGFIRRANGTTSFPAPVATFGRNSLYGINDLGQCVGQFFGPTPLYTDGTALIQLPVQNGFNLGHANRINNNGFIVGSVSASNTNFHAVWWQLGQLSDMFMFDSPANCFADDVNDRGEVVGREYTSPALAATYAYVFEGHSKGRLQDLLTAPMPVGIVRIGGSPTITRSGVITASAFTENGRALPCYATPIDSSTMTVSVGQMGSSPVYVGSIPPSLSVEFATPDGVDIPGTAYQASYSGVTGRANLVVPLSVTGDFRLRLRLNSSVVPGYSGCPYLSRLYPPLAEPPLPFDTYTTPLIEMYPGDVNGSGEIDAADIDGVIEQFGTVSGGPGWLGTGDADGSSEVDAGDIDLVIANFGLAAE